MKYINSYDFWIFSMSGNYNKNDGLIGHGQRFN